MPRSGHGSVRISVLVPTFNSAGFISEALRSALRQDPPPFEVLVQDGGSIDATLDVLRRFGEAVDWVSEADDGQADALNRALHRARGDVVVWLNADDTLLPGALAAATAAFQADPDLAFVYGDYEVIDSAGRVLRRYRSSPYSVDRVLKRGCYIFSGTLFMRRAALAKAGAFDPSLRACMDLDLMLRLGSSGPSRHLGRSIAQFRIHTESKSSTIGFTFVREAFRIRRRYAGRSPRLWLHLIRATLVDAVAQVLSPVRYSSYWPRHGRSKIL